MKDPAPDSTAPRVTLADLEAEIVSEHYFTADTTPRLVMAGPAALPAAGLSFEQTTPDSLKCLTICVLVLRNGFTVTGESACASPENFDRQRGIERAREKAVEKLWPLLGFRLRDAIHGVETQMRNGVL